MAVVGEMKWSESNDRDERFGSYGQHGETRHASNMPERFLFPQPPEATLESPVTMKTFCYTEIAKPSRIGQGVMALKYVCYCVGKIIARLYKLHLFLYDYLLGNI